MRDMERVLILGTGPAALQLAVILKKGDRCHLGIAGRESVRSADFFESLSASGQRVRVSIQNEKHRALEGECRLDGVFRGIETIEGQWDTLILAVTTDAYLEVMRQIDQDVLRKVNSLVLISPTFSSNSLVTGYIGQLNPGAEVISFSTYIGDTRWVDDRVSNHVITTGVKKKVYIGSTRGRSDLVDRLCGLYKQSDIEVEFMRTPLEAEARNISLYVHPALFMNDFSLNAIFDESGTRKYVYKLFPEGPITQELIRNMLSQWKEMMNILGRLGMRSINLLKFMTDDNYPVRNESLSRRDIDSFEHLESIHQEYLLYIRYASLLIDPFSEPDPEGKYFDFSAVPIRRLFINLEGCLDIPRMPKEDYYRIKIIQGIAGFLKVECPTIDRFISAYESKIVSVALAHKDRSLSGAFAVQNFGEELAMICKDLTNT
ncbi:opine metallophore biosynthesis dehydrogenase [Paenibacillus lautus]|uniref:opine metallophore biosynthesis dehydrogenase n=1 Tax=Paenibacillus lautus TaxID=1401 RepID=UPI002FBEC673